MLKLIPNGLELWKWGEKKTYKFLKKKMNNFFYNPRLKKIFLTIIQTQKQKRINLKSQQFIFIAHEREKNINKAKTK